MTRLFFISLFIFSLSVSAKDKLKVDPNCQEGELEKSAKLLMSVAEKAGGCPNVENLKAICDYVGNKYEDDDEDSSYIFLYEKKINQAACVDPNKDSPQEIAKKVQVLWTKYESEFHCTRPDFRIKEGSILKYAVARLSYDFLDLAIDTWKVNLNKIDPDDNRTLLDYVHVKLQENKGNSLEPQLKQYYKKLRAAGAKHKSEL